MKKAITTLNLLFFALLSLFSQQDDFPLLQGKYFGQTPPGINPELFADNILARNYNSFHSTIAFNPEGNECYWQCDFGKQEFTVMWSRIRDGRWTKPEIAPFAKAEYRDDSPFITPDGNRFYFLSRRPLKEGEKIGKENIWVMNRIENGWGEPEPLPECINSMTGIHWQVSADGNGNLYFSSYQMEARGRRGDIYCSENKDGNYSNPVKLESIINSQDYEFSPFISPDGSYLLFSRETYGVGNCRIYITFRTKEGRWTQPVNLYESYGIKGICPMITRDGKFLFYLDYVNSRSQPFWVDARFIEELRPKEH